MTLKDKLIIMRDEILETKDHELNEKRKRETESFFHMIKKCLEQEFNTDPTAERITFIFDEDPNSCDYFHGVYLDDVYFGCIEVMCQEEGIDIEIKEIDGFKMTIFSIDLTDKKEISHTR